MSIPFMAGRHRTTGLPAAQMTEPSVAHATDANFPRIVDSINKDGSLGLIFFYMSHCPYCKQMLPELEKFIYHMGGKVRLVKCELKECPQAMQHHQVQSAPTIFLLKNGQYLQRLDGAGPIETLQNIVNGYM